MHILVATNHLQKTGGTECYTYAIAVELKRLGHDVEYFAFERGEISQRLEEIGIKFRKRIFYDIILANHINVVNHLYKRGFIIQTCHGIAMGLEQPSPKADAYVSISQEVHDYLQKKGIASALIYNGIDCQRFSPTTPIHSKLSSVLSVCQSKEANDIIKEACFQAGVSFNKCDKNEDNCWEIEKKINQADLIIGIGRSLYDAMACGRTVISFDIRGYSSNYGDGYLNSNNIEASIQNNCSGRFSKKHFNSIDILKEFSKYNKEDGFFFRNYAKENLNIKKVVKKYISIYPSNRKIYLRIKKFFILICRNLYWTIKIILKKIF